jgi:hypothetical protein
MDDEFGVGAAAQFMQIHADALTVCVDTEGHKAIEGYQEQVGYGQDQAEQSCDANELGKELSFSWSEAACRDESPEAACRVHGNGSGWVVE